MHIEIYGKHVHIRSLLLTFFHKYMRGLIEKGYVYAAVPPLYRVTYNNKQKYLKDDAELKQFRKSHANVTFKLDRFKGLGEMDPDELRETSLSVDTRTLKQITIDDIEEAKATIDTCMGINTNARREFIESNADKVNNPFDA